MGAWAAVILMAVGSSGAAASPATPPARFTVIAFLGVECPLAKLAATRLNEIHAEYAARGVRFIAYDPNSQDTEAEIEAFVKAHELRFPMVSDCNARTARWLDIRVTPTVVVLDQSKHVVYQGQVDDQFAVGAQKPSATVHYVRDALDDLLAGRTPRLAETKAIGCAIHLETLVCGDDDEEYERQRLPRLQSGTAPVTFAEDVEPIIRRHCVECHRPGAVGPMSFETYEQVRGFAEMIGQVVAENRMPPWKADRRHGPFVGQTALNDTERAKLRGWITSGCRPGDLSIVPPPPKHDLNWSIGPPDAVVELPETQIIPPTGIVEYRILEVDPEFPTDRWVSAIEVRPTDREVVHHCNVFLRPPHSPEAAEAGSLGSVCLAAMAAGTPPVTFRPGMAKRIPAGWKFVFVMHYVTVGTERRDRTLLGLKFADPASVEREVATRLLVDEHLEIPPHAAEHRVEHSTRIDRDLLLLAMFPHMHLRGKSFAYEVDYPDGTRETLLSIPKWDFGWQYRYELEQPKRLPAGTIVRAVAIYDNSKANPANPDPNATVRTGPNSHDEMFNGYFDVANADPEYPTRTPWHRKLARGAATGLVLLAIALRLRMNWKAK
jgi:peroxiredoxin